MTEPAPIGTPDLEATVDVDAPADLVWETVTDVTRTPEWSPVVKRSEWVGAVTKAQVGARFRGFNRFNGFRWSRECIVSAAEEGHTFAFSTLGRDGREQTRWRYDVAPTGESGTRLTLAYEIVTMPRWVRLARRIPGGRATNDRQARWNLDESLRRLKEQMEAAARPARPE